MNLSSCPPHPLGKKRRGKHQQFLIAMRLAILFTLFCCLKVTAAVYAQKVSLNLKDATIEAALNEIKTQSGYSLITKDNLFDKTSKVTIHLKDVTVNEALDACFRGQPITYDIIGKTIVVKEKNTLRNSKTISNTKLVDTIKGTVRDSAGISLRGATIRTQNSTKSTITDDKGNFILPGILSGTILSVSYIGYISRQVAASTDKAMYIILSQSTSRLDEVVVIPYGTTTGRLNTGSIGKVAAADIDKQPVANPLATLEGRVPGLVVTQTTGVPGGAFRVEVRGRTSIQKDITDDQPLFIIDGVPFGPNNGLLGSAPSALGNPGNESNLYNGGLSPFNSINPLDIESIEVLKDADATAIYGSRGANGVILITTKKGRAGKTKFDLNFNSGISSASSMIQMMDTKEYLAIRRAAFINDNVTPNTANGYDLLSWDTTRYTNFGKFLNGGTAHSNDAQLSLSGGVANTQFLVSGSFHRETTITPGDLGYQRGNLHFNINHSSPDQKLKMQFSGSYSADQNNLSSGDMAAYSMLPPHMQVYNADGSLAWNEGGIAPIYKNPLSYLNSTFSSKTNNLISNLLLNYRVLKGLTIRLSSGYNIIKSSQTSLYPSTAQNPASVINRTHSFDANTFNSWILEPQAEYRTLISKGTLDVLLGGTMQSVTSDGNSFYAAGYTSDNLINSANAAATTQANNSYSEYRYEALFGRVNYNWEDKYLLNLSIRRDGSSRFGPGKQFANFGAIGAGWIFSNESFLQSNDSVLSFGKLRGSFGITGNDKIKDYQYLDTWATSFQAYNGKPGLYSNKLYNPDYRWEKTNKFEGAIELGFFNDKVLFTTSWYRNTSSNQLVYIVMPSTSGGGILGNFPAKVENKGWEFSVTSTNIKQKDFTWTTSANISLPNNKLLSFPGLATSSYFSMYVEGQSLNLIYKYKYTGVDPQTGLYTFEDIDKNGSLDYNDYQVLGSLDPKFYGGLQNSFKYKGFQFDVFMSFKKQTGTNYLASLGFMPGTINNFPQAMNGNFWQKQGDNSIYQKLTQLSSGPTADAYQNLSNFSNGIYSDASYIRIKNASLSYSLPKNILDKLHFENLRIYLSGQNLFTITGYKDGDPETQTPFRTAPLKTYILGIQLTL